MYFILLSIVSHISRHRIKQLNGIFLRNYRLNLAECLMSLNPLREEEEFHFLHARCRNIKICLEDYICQ